jgi:hypothetical protein
MRQGEHFPQDSSTVKFKEKLGDIHHAVILVHYNKPPEPIIEPIAIKLS